MKKLILTAMLLLAVSLCSCYAPNHSTDTPTRADLDLPLSDVTEPYAPPASEKWQYDPDPYDDVKIYGGMIGGGTAFVTVKDDLCTLTVEISETVSSVVNFDLKTTYTVTGLSLIRPQTPKKANTPFMQRHTPSQHHANRLPTALS